MMNPSDAGAKFGATASHFNFGAVIVKTADVDGFVKVATADAPAMPLVQNCDALSPLGTSKDIDNDPSFRRSAVSVIEFRKRSRSMPPFTEKPKLRVARVTPPTTRTKCDRMNG